MLEFSRILTALGAAAFGVGFTVYGIGISLDGGSNFEQTFGLILTVVGLIAALVGYVMHHNLAEE